MHAWKFMGFGSYGRGKLYKCERPHCNKSKRIKITIEELQDQLDDEVELVKDRLPKWANKVSFADGSIEFICKFCKISHKETKEAQCPYCKK